MSDDGKRKLFANWLTRKIIEREAKEGRRLTYDEEAAAMGIKPQILSHYINRRSLPGRDNLPKIAQRYGLEVYDLLGIPRPLGAIDDPDLAYIVEAWPSIPLEKRKELMKLYEELLDGS